MIRGARVHSLGPMRLLLLLIALALVAAACGEDVQGTCRNENCLKGQACNADGKCAALTPPGQIGDLGRFTSFGLRSDGSRVVATYDSSYGSLILKSEDPETSTFDAQIVDGWRVEDHTLADTDAGKWTAMAMGDDNSAHLAWYDADRGELRYARIRPEGPWTIETVDGSGASDCGQHAAIALAEDDTPHLAYRDATKRGLRHAFRGPDGTWTTNALSGCTDEPGCPSEQGEDYGEYAAMAVIAGHPRIAFYDRRRGDLKMAERGAGGQWSTSTLDGRDPTSGEDTGDVGRFAAVAVDSSSRMAIAYYDATRTALKILFPGGGSELQSLIVDDGVYVDDTSLAKRSHIVGQHVAMSFDNQGVAVLVYLDASRLILKRATVSGDAIEVQDLPELSGGGYIDFAITSEGVVQGAYGAWVPNEAPRTTLELFDVERGAP